MDGVYKPTIGKLMIGGARVRVMRRVEGRILWLCWVGRWCERRCCLLYLLPKRRKIADIFNESEMVTFPLERILDRRLDVEPLLRFLLQSFFSPWHTHENTLMCTR